MSLNWYTLAWEPSAAKVTKSYSRRLPALNDFTGKLKFVIKVDQLNVESQNQAKDLPVGLPSSPIKIWGKSVQGFLSYDRTNKQTERWQTDKQSLQLYICRCFSIHFETSWFVVVIKYKIACFKILLVWSYKQRIKWLQKNCQTI